MKEIDLGELRDYIIENDNDGFFIDIQFSLSPIETIITYCEGLEFEFKIEIEDSKLVIENIKIEERHQGEGLGTKLIELLKSYFRSKDFNSIEAVEVQKSAQDFWKRVGFRPDEESTWTFNL